MPGRSGLKACEGRLGDFGLPEAATVRRVKGFPPPVAAKWNDGSFGIGPGPSTAIVEAAQLFAGLRKVLNLSLDAAADLLATEPNVIAALETGQIDALPPWPETQRLVSAYTGLAGCDPGPVLSILRAELDRRHNDSSRAIGATVSEFSDRAAPPTFLTRQPGPSPNAPEDPVEIQQAGPRWRKGRGGRPVPVGSALVDQAENARPRLKYRLSTAGIGAGLVRGVSTVVLNRGVYIGILSVGLVAAIVFALCQPTVVSILSSRLPDPMSRGLRSVHDYLLIRFAPEREGLRWIEVDDPRARRTDKLHNVRQTD